MASKTLAGRRVRRGGGRKRHDAKPSLATRRQPAFLNPCPRCDRVAMHRAGCPLFMGASDVQIKAEAGRRAQELRP